ncbi:hypothetical protein F2Q69_00061436 [Brassica cretica]|uniref:Uncharacterized protein n=1 Tax=Brassica cretica TaxID=69181 RepID=A0A8S9RLX4_BRACR|nr:hypothetical protein F2Q69_00061436 [Brassica cretica]
MHVSHSNHRSFNDASCTPIEKFISIFYHWTKYLPPVLHRYTDVTEKLTRLDPVTSSATKDPLYATTGPGIWKVTGARKYLNEQN